MNFAIITKKILRNKNDYGLFITFKKSIAYIIKPFYENKTYRIYRLNLDSYQFMPSSGCTYIFRWIDHDDTILIEQIENMEEWLKGKVRILLQSSYLCMVALDGEKVAGFNIITLDKGRLPLIAFSKKLRDHEAWSVQITVNKNYRGKGLATELRYRVFNELKKMGLKTFYHSDGSIVPVIDDLIDLGLDLLDPIQVTAAGMRPEELFPKFGDRLSFHGAIDEVGILPTLSAEEVYRETQRVISILGKNGGYVVSSTHMIQGDTPSENVFAMIKAIKDYKYNWSQRK